MKIKDLSMSYGTDSLFQDINIVIPGKNLIELSKIVNDESDQIEIHIFSNNILFIRFFIIVKFQS